MKVLTDEAKVYLIELCGYKLVSMSMVLEPSFDDGSGKFTPITAFNPNQSDSTYCMKYFGDLVNAYREKTGYCIIPDINDLDGDVRDILEMTDFTGGAWV